MASTYARIKALVEGLADAAGGLTKIALGTTGSTVMWPSDESKFRKSRDTGTIWDSTAAVIPTALQGLGSDLDRALLSWGIISTNATGVAPTLTNGSLIDGTNLAKDEVNDTLTVVLDPGYSAAANLVAFAYLYGGHYITKTTVVSAASVKFEFTDDAGNLQVINNQTVWALFCGTSA